MTECNDEKCPVHGHVKVRGNVFVGTVKSAKAAKTVIVERKIVHFVPKYERYKKVKSTMAAHNPPCMNAKEGDIVKIGETRKLSKTKAFVVLSIEGHEKAELKEKEDVQAKQAASSKSEDGARESRTQPAKGEER